MTFKEDWESTSLSRDIEERDIKEMVEVAFPGRELDSFAVLPGGCANVNIKIKLKKKGEVFILRVYIRDRKKALIEEGIYKCLKGKVPVPSFFKAYKSPNYTFAVSEFVEGITLRDFLLDKRDKGLLEESRTREQIEGVMEEVGNLLASIHTVTFKKSGFFSSNLETVTPFEEGGYISYAKTFLENEELKKIFSTAQREKIIEGLEKNQKYFPGAEESNLVHGDFNPANLLVKEEDGRVKITAVLDFEYAFSGSNLADIADMLRESHKMPAYYKEAFLKGLANGNFWIPEKLKESISLINIVTLLDCVDKSPHKPNLVKDSKELVLHFVEELFRTKIIEVLPYDPAWEKQYEKEVREIQECLGEAVCLDVHHFGSTSVPGLSAKKDLDIILVVDELEHSLPLQQIGYVFKEEIHTPLCYFFSKNTTESKVNLHVCEKDHGFIGLNLTIRDYLRSHEEEKKAYASLKEKAASDKEAGIRVKGRLSKYGRTKDPFIKRLLQKAGYKDHIVSFCFHEKEWEEASRLNGAPIKEINDDHKYFILYKGIDIIGFAHIERLKEGDFTLRKIVVEADNTSKLFFENLLEKWVRSQKEKVGK